MDLEQLQRLCHRTLNNTDINGHLVFPITLIDHIWGPNDPLPEKYFHVADRSGKQWGLRAHMRWDPQGEPKPDVDGPEWKQFVKHNHLKVGDKLVFYRPPNPTPNPNPSPSQVVFVVSIEREMRLMGKTFSGHINYTLA